MNLSFYGGARALTGHCYLLEVGDQNILINCGFQQGYDELNRNALDFYASRIDHVLVTHAHVDNTGRLPLLVQEGYYGRIITTPETKKLMSSILKERADFHVNDAWWRNQKGLRSGMAPIAPMFSMMDVVSTMQQVETEPYDKKFTLCPGVEVRFINSGHMLGSASIEIWATEGEFTRSIVFSGDLGCKEMPFTPPPSHVEEADYVVIDSTYGDRTHENTLSIHNLGEFAEAIDITLSHAGNVIIPANVVGRTQEVLFALKQIKEQKMVKGFPQFKVYLDSFLADEAVRILEGNPDMDLGEFGTAGKYQGDNNPFVFPDLVLCKTVEESKALNYDRTPKVIIAASGMSDRGRMKHHMKHNLWRKECAILHLGHLGVGSLGRRLQDGLNTVRLFGEDIVVRARILEFTSNPSHADKPQLLEWLGKIEEKPQHIFVVHGNESACESFTETLLQEGYNAHAPFNREVYDLLDNCVDTPGVKVEEQSIAQRGRSFSLSYIHLEDAVRDLSRTVQDGRWHTGDDFEAMTKEIRKLIATWQPPEDEN